MYIRARYLIMGVVLAMVLSSGVTTLALNWVGAGGPIAALPVTKDEQFTKLMQAYNTLSEHYYQDVKSDDLLNGAIDGMVKSLDDPYSTYMDQQEANSFHENISSSFEGIGAEIREEEGKIVIVSPMKNSPAEKAGLKPNDVIVSVDGKKLSGMKVSEAVLHIRGKKGSKAELVIERAGQSGEMTVPIVRDTIPLETVYHEMRPDNMGKIQITKYAETTAEEFKKAVADLKSQGAKGLIIDLRQNPGGLLNIAKELGDMLVADGKVVLQVEYRTGEKEVYRAKGEDKVNLPIVCLIDGGSASASEIMAGFLKEAGGVPLVGEKSFGKGTVQTAQDFEDGSNIKFTTAKWLTPDGNWVHKNGIEPDYKVALPKYADLPYIDPDKELKPETFSNEIKTAQVMLEALGHHPGREDGFFDSKTKDAVIAFQKAQNLPTTGIISGKTTFRMIELLQEKIKQNDTQLEAAELVLRKMIK